MATLKTNELKTGVSYTVEWRTGGTRDGKWCTETFKVEADAKFFKLDVERHHHQYPPNYLRRFGYVDPQILAEEKARKAAEEARAAIVAPVYFKDRFETFLKTRSGIEERTVRDYMRQYDNHFAKPFGDLVVNVAAEVPEEHRFDGDKVKIWVNQKHRGLRDPDARNGRWLVEPRSPKTVRNLHALLSSYSAWLVEKGLLAVNPCTGTNLPDSDEGDADVEMVFLEVPEYKLLIDAAGADARDLIRFLVGTGLRYSEATGLKIKDLYLGAAEPYLMVRHAWKRQVDGSHCLGKPKSKASRRKVELLGNRPIIALLARLSAGRNDEEFVFISPTGVHWRHANFYNRCWTQAVYRAVRCERHRAADGIANMHDLKMRFAVPCGCPGTLGKRPRIHDLRHTCAAWLIERGVSLLAVQRQFGHESYVTTEKRYGHLTKGAKAAMGNAIDDVLSEEDGVDGMAAALAEQYRRQDRRSRRQRMFARRVGTLERRG